ncbi:MAG: hypothetical protein LBE55_00605 [Clostridiales bacterium]|jgi:hypothetical protein|nr:hypothetical protein [Clostridiales bacterium]
MKKWKILLMILSALFALSACDGYEHYQPEEPLEEIEEIEEVEKAEEIRAEILTLDWQHIMDVAANRRTEIEKPDYTAFLDMTQVRTPVRRMPQRFWRDWGGTENLPEYFPVEYAARDAWVLFNALRHVYGGYVYFGGDDVFSAMLGDITTEFFLLGEEMITADSFARILHSHLNQVVIDNHFWIGDLRMGLNLSYFHRRGIYYDKTENGFRNRATDLYLLEIEGHDIGEAMRLHANGDGELFYRPVFLLDSSMIAARAYFMYEDGRRENRIFINEGAPRRKQLELPTLQHIDGVPVLTVMAMGFDGHENAAGIAHAEPFMAYARQLRDEPVVIVDIRDNTGGNGLLPVRWLHVLTDEIVPSNYVWLSARPYSSADFDFNPNNSHQNPPNSWRTYADVGPFGENYTIFNTAPRRIVPREQLLILLTNRGTGSAAEDIVDRAFNIENTLIIGTATGGVLAFDATYSPVNLPNTGMPFGLGRALMLWPDGHFAEGVGIAPDIWVSGDALAAALALISP